MAEQDNPLSRRPSSMNGSQENVSSLREAVEAMLYYLQNACPYPREVTAVTTEAFTRAFTAGGIRGEELMDAAVAWAMESSKWPGPADIGRHVTKARVERFYSAAVPMALPRRELSEEEQAARLKEFEEARADMEANGYRVIKREPETAAKKAVLARPEYVEPTPEEMEETRRRLAALKEESQ